MRAAIVAFALIGVGCGKTSAAPPPIPWTTLANGEQLARATGRPAFVFFFATWSTADKELDDVTFTNPAVRAEMQNFIPIRVDVSDDDIPAVNAAKDRFAVIGVPTLLAVKSFDEYPGHGHEGEPRELFRANEFMPAENLVPKLRAAKRDCQ